MKKISPLKSQTLIAALLCAGMLTASASLTAQAKWQSKKKKAEQEAVEKVQTFQPPPADAVTRYCEPYRAEAVSLHQKPFFIRPFYEPKRSWLIHKHQKCRQELMAQEATYLKHADIEQSPSLPKITPGSKPGAPNGNL